MSDPIPMVAFDEIIEESWGDKVARSLNRLDEADQQLLWKPTGDIPAPTSGTMTQWFRVDPDAEITVPDWAHHVLVNVGLTGLHEEAAGDDTYVLQVVVGPTAGRTVRFTGRATGWFAATWTDYLACSSIEGDRSIKINCARIDGDDRWIADVNTDVAVWFVFKGAIG